MNHEDQTNFPKLMLVDQSGHLWVLPELGIKYQRYKFAHLASEGIANFVEMRFLNPGQLQKNPGDKIDQIIKPDFISKVPFTRLASDYAPSDLLIQNAAQARAARLVWALWTGNLDLHFFNSHTVEGIPIDFDLTDAFESESFDIKNYILRLEESFLTFPAQESEPYRRLDGYDLKTIGETVRKILAKDVAGISGLENYMPNVFQGVSTGKEIIHGLVIHHELARARLHEHPRHRSLAPAGSVVIVRYHVVS